MRRPRREEVRLTSGEKRVTGTLVHLKIYYKSQRAGKCLSCHIRTLSLIIVSGRLRLRRRGRASADGAPRVAFELYTLQRDGICFRVSLCPQPHCRMVHTDTRTGATRPNYSTPPPAGLPHGVSRMMVVLLLMLALHLLGEAEPVHPSEHLPHARQPNSERMPCAPW